MVSHAYVNFYQKLMTRPAAATLDPEQIKKNFQALLADYSHNPDVKLENSHLGGVPVLWAKAPGSQAKNIILFFHGGGFVAGSSYSHRDLMGRLSAKTNTWVVGVDYRQTPDHPFPAALEDAVHVYQALLHMGHSASSLLCVGCSAGANLALAMMLKLKKEHQNLPAAAALIAPWVDLSLSTESLISNRGKDVVSYDRMVLYRDLYIKHHSPKDPLASPIEGDLHALPPLFIQTGTNDLLHSEAVKLYEKAKKAKLTVELDEWTHMIHSFALFAKDFPEGDVAIDRIAQFLTKYSL